MLSCAAFCNVVPYYFSSLKVSPVGFTFVKSPLNMRNIPDRNAPVVEVVSFDFDDNISCFRDEGCKVSEVFSVYVKEKKVAVMSAVDKTDEWNFVCFNKSKNKTCGWVEDKDNKFYGLMDFYNIFGRKYGLYILHDLSKADRTIYSSPTKNTNSTGELMLPKSITPWLVQGNWILVKVLDFDNDKKTGWFNFRDESGRLKLFVNF